MSQFPSATSPRTSVSPIGTPPTSRPTTPVSPTGQPSPKTPVSNPSAFQSQSSGLVVVSPGGDSVVDKSPLLSGKSMSSLVERMPLSEHDGLIGTVKTAIHDDVSRAIHRSDTSKELLGALEEIGTEHRTKITKMCDSDPSLAGIKDQLLQILDKEITHGLSVADELDSKVQSTSSLKPKSSSKTSALDQEIPSVEPFAKGGNKIAHRIMDGKYQDEVLLVSKNHGKNITEVEKEMVNLLALEKMGVPLIPILARGTFDGLPAYVVPVMDLDSKSLVKIDDGHAVTQDGHTKAAVILNRKSISDLRAIQTAMMKNSIAIMDLQFMISDEGDVYLTDPGDILTPKDGDYSVQKKRGNEIIESLIQMAEKFGDNEVEQVDSDGSDVEDESESPQDIWDESSDELLKIVDSSMPMKARTNRARDYAEEIEILQANKADFDEPTQVKIQNMYDFAVEKGFI